MTTTANLVITFDETVDVESGDIVIYDASDGSIFETIDVTSGQVTGTGTATITINPSSDFASEAAYYINIDATAFDDASSNSYAGISDATTWNFTADDVTAPTITGVAVASDNTTIAVTFSEAVYTNTGTDPLVAADFALSISGGTATVAALPSSISISGNVYTLGLNFTSASPYGNGAEVLTIVPASGTSIYDAADNAASTSQSNNTITLNDLTPPTILNTGTLAANNLTVAVTFSEAVYTNTGTDPLVAADFALSISGGTATVAALPSSISISGNVYTLGLNFTSASPYGNGSEVLTIVPASGTSIYDAADNAASTSQSNNTITLNDQLSPTMTITAAEGSDGFTYK